jgi:CBS domain containing-hemolysin-like protein
VNDELGIDLPEGEEFETLAGFIFNRAGRLVEQGETIDYEGVRIHVGEVDNTRIMRARIELPEGDEPPEESDAEPVPEADAADAATDGG